MGEYVGGPLVIEPVRGERHNMYAERVAAALDCVEPVRALTTTAKPLPYVFPSPSLVPPGGDETVIGVLRQLLNARMITREQVIDFNLNLDAAVWEREEATYAWYRRPSGATNRAENERLRVENERLQRALCDRDAELERRYVLTKQAWAACRAMTNARVVTPEQVEDSVASEPDPELWDFDPNRGCWYRRYTRLPLEPTPAVFPLGRAVQPIGLSRNEPA